MMKNKVVVLGGSHDQVPLIEELKARGYYTILIDFYKEPLAKKMVDKHYQETTHDFNKVLKITKNEKPKFITSIGNDPVLPIIAKVSEILNAKTLLNYKDIIRATDKKLMKEVFIKYNISIPKSYPSENINHREITLPVIVKPKSGTGSKDVFKFEEPDSLIKYLKDNNPSNIIIEEFIEGIEVSVDCFVYKGSVTVLLVTQLFQVPFLKRSFSFLYTQYPAQLKTEVTTKIRKIAEKLSYGFNINNGPLFFQAKIKNNTVYVLEVGIRLAGGLKYKFIEKITGFNPLKAQIDILEEKDLNIEINKDGYLYSQVFVYAKEGLINKISIPPCINDYYIYKNKGQRSSGGFTVKDRIIQFTLKDATFEKLNLNRAKFLKSIKILSEDGNDLAYKNLL